MDKQAVEQRVCDAKAALVQEPTKSNRESHTREYVEHHLDEIGDDYWKRNFGESRPSVELVVSKIVAEPFWLEEALEGEADLDRVDLTLPDEITNYLLCVEFSHDGSVLTTSMES